MKATHSRSKSVAGKEILPLLPLRDIVIFPHMVVPLLVGRETSIKALDEAMLHDKVIFLCTQKNMKEDDPGVDDIYHIGTVANVIQMLKLPEGSFKILVEGVSRASIKNFVSEKEFYKVQVGLLDSYTKKTLETEALMRGVLNQFEAAGLVVKHNFESGQAFYELDSGEHHDHLVCVETGKVTEFVSEEIEKLQAESAAEHGYDIEDHNLVIYVRPKKGR